MNTLEEQDEDDEMPAIMKHCVVDLVDEDDRDVSTAFAICTESYQDDGYLKDGSHELTQKGKSLEKEHQNRDDHEDVVSRYKSLVGESVDRDRGRRDLVERAATLLDEAEKSTDGGQ